MTYPDDAPILDFDPAREAVLEPHLAIKKFDRPRSASSAGGRGRAADRANRPAYLTLMHRPGNRAAGLVVAIGLTVACQPSPTAVPSAAPLTRALPVSVAGGCGDTQVFADSGPDAELGLAGNAWAAATPASAGVVAYFFHAPPNLIEVAGPNQPTKVLWIYHGEPQPGNVTIDVHPLGASAPHINSTIGYAVANGGNYPSSIDVPSPGCWRVDLSLGATHATLDLQVAASP